MGKEKLIRTLGIVFEVSCNRKVVQGRNVRYGVVYEVVLLSLLLETGALKYVM